MPAIGSSNQGLARINKEPDFKLITALVLSVKLEAVKGLVLVAGSAKDYRLVFFCARLVGKDIHLHRFISIHCFVEWATPAHP
jgi:hypothetical protein